MRILWLCNFAVPTIASDLGLPEPGGGGWITGMLNGILATPEAPIEMGFCFPFLTQKKLIMGQVNGVRYYGFPKELLEPTQYDPSVEQCFKTILADFRPDLVHIFGTEFPHTLAMTRAFARPEQTLINIQGLCSICAKHYCTGLPSRVIRRHTFRDFVRRDSIYEQANKFAIRGAFEIEAIQNVRHVVGRTDWDRACTLQINPQAQYHFCNETLREEFYLHRWSLEGCQRHSIFLSQVYYPVKGFHFMLEAMPEILKRYPDAHLFISSTDITQRDSWMQKLRMSSYPQYIRQLIVQYRLGEHITFLGSMGAQEMCQQFLNAHVFVSPSTIENESNSISEAKILGVPVVASYVGGVTTRLSHGEEGFLYQQDAPYMLAHYVCSIFEDDELALRFSENARRQAQHTLDPATNLKAMLDIYRGLAE